MGSDIEKELLAHSLPKRRLKWWWALLAGLALVPFGYIVWSFAKAGKVALFSSPHDVTLVAYGECPKAKVMTRLPTEVTGWTETELPFRLTRKLSESDAATISVTSSGSCTVGCRVEVDGKPRMAEQASYASCEYP